MPGPVVEVALPLPVLSTFSYRLPEGTAAPARGVRVLVPFGARRVLGVVTGAGSADTGRELKQVLQVIDETPVPPPALLDLASWVADHYLAPPGECFRLILPPAGLRASRAVARLANDPGTGGDPVVEALRGGPLRVSTLGSRLGRDPAGTLVRLRQAGVVTIEQALEMPGFRRVREAILTGQEAMPRGAGQAALLDRLRHAGGRMAVADLVRDRPSLRGALRRLMEIGAVRFEETRATRTPIFPAPDPEPAPAPQPSADQERALGPMVEAVQGRRFEPFLLHGVTASGKTEVYFRAAERALELGRGCLILVPEIALTPLLIRAATARFGATVSVLHSGLSAGERHDQWWRIRTGGARVVVGARSAVFAPIEELGLIVVDEEHDAAYKQQESPRYHARDVAVVRARMEAAPVVLGSATPSVESHANAVKGKYRRLVLATRIGTRDLPRVEIVDRRAAVKAGDDPILTTPLRQALADRLIRQEQSLLLLNRRGYATSLVCRECGQPSVCRNCSVSLAMHQQGRIARCHYCGYRVQAPERCPACRGEYLRLTGHGTERVVEVVQAALPAARVERLDSDMASRRGAVSRVLTAFEEGRIDILVGTQMVAKGHDFPRVTLVGVVDADVGLGLPDFRAAERTFQILTQVAGRAGRGEVSGEVVLQSHLPDHYALVFACGQDYLSFFEREMEFRTTMGYPPNTALVNLILRTRDPRSGAEAAEGVASRLRQLAAGRYRVLGPAFAPLARLRQEHRVQILLKGQRAAMRTAVREVLTERYGRQRWPGVAVDVDPVTVM